MPSCTLTLSANAGIVMELDGLRLWVDVLHDQPVPGLSSVTPEMLVRMETDAHFQAPDVLFYTHLHPDHFSARLTAGALARWPDALLAMPPAPGRTFPRQLSLTGQAVSVTHRGAALHFHYLPHLGRHSNKIPHYGCIVEYHGVRILFAGDAVGAGHALKELLDGKPPDIAVLAFPWITTQGGRATIERFIRPAHIAAVHIPFSCDDTENYRAAVTAAAPLMKTDTRLFLEPFQSETFHLDGKARQDQ